MYPGIVQQENLANTEEQLRRVLFGKGQEGVWFDPSDLSTMFQDAAGRVPVTADGDPIGLILDKHSKDFRGIVNLLTDSEDFSDTSDWLNPGDFTLEEVSSILGNSSVAYKHTNLGNANSRSRAQGSIVVAEPKVYYGQVMCEQGTSNSILIGIRDITTNNWVSSFRYNFVTDSITFFSGGEGTNLAASFVVQPETPNGGKTVEFRIEGEPLNVGNILGFYIYPTDTPANTDSTIIHWAQFSDKGYEPYQKKTDTLAVEGNHAIASSPTDFTYRTDGTLHWVETTTVGTLAFDSIIYPDESNVCRFGINKRNPGSNIGTLSSTISSVSPRWIMVSSASGVGDFTLTGPIYNQIGPSRVNGSVFTGDRADLYNITSSGISIVGVVGINCSAENGQAIGVSGRYDSQLFDGNSMYGFIEYHDNLSQGVYEFVEQYLADKAGITLP